TGQVTLWDGPVGTGLKLGTVALNATGQAALTMVRRGVGTHSINAAYTGSTGFSASGTNLGPDLTVGPATVSLTGLSAPTIVAGTATATLSGHLNVNVGLLPVPAGETVQLTLAGQTQTATLDANDNFSATFATGNLSAASSPYTITCTYGGDGNFA